MEWLRDLSPKATEFHYENSRPSRAKSKAPGLGCNRELEISPMKPAEFPSENALFHSARPFFPQGKPRTINARGARRASRRSCRAPRRAREARTATYS